MIRLLLNHYTEREKLLLLQALFAADDYLFKRHIEYHEAPHLFDDLQKARLFTAGEHAHDIIARTLGIDTHTADLDAAPEVAIDQDDLPPRAVLDLLMGLGE